MKRLIASVLFGVEFSLRLDGLGLYNKSYKTITKPNPNKSKLI
jgi:hypothetical protein